VIPRASRVLIVLAVALGLLVARVSNPAHASGPIAITNISVGVNRGTVTYYMCVQSDSTPNGYLSGVAITKPDGTSLESGYMTVNDLRCGGASAAYLLTVSIPNLVRGQYLFQSAATTGTSTAQSAASIDRAYEFASNRNGSNVGTGCQVDFDPSVDMTPQNCTAIGAQGDLTVAAPPPTNTPVPVPTNTPVPVPTNTSVPVPTNTSVPIPTDTSQPTNTSVPSTSGPTNTPVPLLTNTPRPTNTPVPVPTNTPVPVPTNTSVPNPTNTSVPNPTNTSAPPPTYIPPPVVNSGPPAVSTSTPTPMNTPTVSNHTASNPTTTPTTSPNGHGTGSGGSTGFGVTSKPTQLAGTTHVTAMLRLVTPAMLVRPNDVAPVTIFYAPNVRARVTFSIPGQRSTTSSVLWTNKGGRFTVRFRVPGSIKLNKGRATIGVSVHGIGVTPTTQVTGALGVSDMVVTSSQSFAAAKSAMYCQQRQTIQVSYHANTPLRIILGFPHNHQTILTTRTDQHGQASVGIQLHVVNALSPVRINVRVLDATVRPTPKPLPTPKPQGKKTGASTHPVAKQQPPRTEQMTMTLVVPQPCRKDNGSVSIVGLQK